MTNTNDIQQLIKDATSIMDEWDTKSSELLTGDIHTIDEIDATFDVLDTYTKMIEYKVALVIDHINDLRDHYIENGIKLQSPDLIELMYTASDIIYRSTNIFKKVIIRIDELHKLRRDISSNKAS